MENSGKTGPKPINAEKSATPEKTGPDKLRGDIMVLLRSTNLEKLLARKINVIKTTPLNKWDILVVELDIWLEDEKDGSKKLFVIKAEGNREDIKPNLRESITAEIGKDPALKEKIISLDLKLQVLVRHGNDVPKEKCVVQFNKTEHVAISGKPKSLENTYTPADLSEDILGLLIKKTFIGNILNGRAFVNNHESKDADLIVVKINLWLKNLKSEKNKNILIEAEGIAKTIQKNLYDAILGGLSEKIQNSGTEHEKITVLKSTLQIFSRDNTSISKEGSRLIFSKDEDSLKP